MSQIAEYARNLHENESSAHSRVLEPIDYPSRAEKITEVRAVVFDVYGTLLNYWRPGFESPELRATTLLQSFRIIADRFGMNSVLREINPNEEPEKTLSDFYHGLIALKHEKGIKEGVSFPEVKIEEIWSLIFIILKRRGYNPAEFNPGPSDDFGRFIAFTYNFYALGRQLYPGVVDALERLREQNIMLGILSNAQFYTPIDLTLLLRDQSNGKIDDYNELFDIDLTFFSYEYGVAKPDSLLFRKLFDSLYEYQILPSQTVLVGNDLVLDIKPAIDAGMKTAFFTGDRESAFTHDLAGEVVPDISFGSWEQLPSRISFFSEESRS